jgi:hypothetical protein
MGEFSVEGEVSPLFHAVPTLLRDEAVVILGPGDLRILVEFDKSVRARSETVDAAWKMARILSEHWDEVAHG